MMDRLTKKYAGGYGLVNVKDNEQSVESSHPNTLREILKSIKKLGAYEDTGLTPEEIAELVQAKREGRCVVLPCKIGQKLYDFFKYFEPVESPEFYEADAKEITISKGKDGELVFTIDCNDYEQSDFGKTIFRSILEAEKALEVQNER